MSITQGMTTSFKVELFTLTHDFGVAGDTFKIALYTSSASLGPTTTAYSSTNEVTGTGYTAGGATLTNVAPSSSGTTAIVDFADVTFSTVTFSTTASAPRGALIYNSSKSNKAVAVLDFGRSILKTAADLVVTMPTFDGQNAIIRIL